MYYKNVSNEEKSPEMNNQKTLISLFVMENLELNSNPRRQFSPAIRKGIAGDYYGRNTA